LSSVRERVQLEWPRVSVRDRQTVSAIEMVRNRELTFCACPNRTPLHCFTTQSCIPTSPSITSLRSRSVPLHAQSAALAQTSINGSPLFLALPCSSARFRLNVQVPNISLSYSSPRSSSWAQSPIEASSPSSSFEPCIDR